MFGRLFLVLVLLAVSLYVVKLLKTKLEEHADRLEKDDSRNESVEKKNVEGDKIVKCLHCGLHIPENEAIKQGEKVFCSLDHAGQNM